MTDEILEKAYRLRSDYENLESGLRSFEKSTLLTTFKDTCTWQSPQIIERLEQKYKKEIKEAIEKEIKSLKKQFAAL